MQTPAPTVTVSKKVLWTGRIMSALSVLLLLFSAVMKLANLPGLAPGFAHFGIPISQAFGLGVLEFACAVVYMIPRTSFLGAILMTGYLGGATATNVRVGDPCYIPVILGVLVWGGLFLREPRLRALIPLKSQTPSLED
jgi:DoxX-like family